MSAFKSSKTSPHRNTPVVETRRTYDKRRGMRNKILVVDDDAELVELVSFNLKQAGYVTGSASNGVEAIKKARTLEPDLIVLDVMMPELDGFAVCEILRRDPATASIPIMMLTALSSQLGRMAGLGSGASDFLTKPFSPRLLIARIEDLLKKTANIAPSPAA
jgi:DNA-binding response OmpR family regulator